MSRLHLKHANVQAQGFVQLLRDMYQEMDVVRHYHVLQKAQVFAETAEQPQVLLNNSAQRAFLYVHIRENARQLAETRNAGRFCHSYTVHAFGTVVVMKGAWHGWKCCRLYRCESKLSPQSKEVN